MITFQDALTIINREIQTIEYPQNPAGLYEPVAYLLAMKGKKLRPALALLSCNLYRENIEEALNPALAWEIFHNFTLMHDDVMDKADIRRDQPTVHKKWNENTAILSGDAMLILSYKFMAKSPSNQLNTLLDLFSQTAAEICEGQQYDMEFEKQIDVTEAEYIHMIRLKTAVMLGACLKTGAIIGDADENDRQNLYDFGINLGIAFQIKDDLLDIYGNQDVFGKKIGGDILCNKKTYLLVKALETAENEDKSELLRWIQTDIQSEEKIEAVRQLYDKLAIKDKACQAMEIYYEKAKTLLEAVSVNEEKKKTIINLAMDLMEREY
jgi:geranylgeranyl diphosphate synthase type II